MINIGKINEVKVPSYYKPKMTITGNSAELQFCTAFFHKNVIKRINKNQYMYLYNTVDHIRGEICDYQKHAKTRKDNYKSILRAVKKCKDLINANFFAEKNELFITLTYKENMRNPKKMYNDLKNFIRNIKKYFKNQELLYILVVEPQGRGAWHAHILMKNLSWTDKKNQWYIPKTKIEELWARKGFVKVEKIETIDDLGTYLSSYLTNLEKGKKNSRLNLYPNGINIYRYSRNCKKPTVIKNETFLNALNYLKNHWDIEALPKPIYSYTTFLATDDGYEIAVAKIKIHKLKNKNKVLRLDDYIDNERSLNCDYVRTAEYQLKQLLKNNQNLLTVTT